MDDTVQGGQGGIADKLAEGEEEAQAAFKDMDDHVLLQKPINEQEEEDTQGAEEELPRPTEVRNLHANHPEGRTVAMFVREFVILVGRR